MFGRRSKGMKLELNIFLVSIKDSFSHPTDLFIRIERSPNKDLVGLIILSPR